MKMFQDLFCICDNCKNGVKCLQNVALKEYLFLACRFGHGKNFLQGEQKSVFQRVTKMLFPRAGQQKEISFYQLERKMKIF